MEVPTIRINPTVNPGGGDDRRQRGGWGSALLLHGGRRAVATARRRAQLAECVPIYVALGARGRRGTLDSSGCRSGDATVGATVGASALPKALVAGVLTLGLGGNPHHAAHLHLELASDGRVWDRAQFTSTVYGVGSFSTFAGASTASLTCFCYFSQGTWEGCLYLQPYSLCLTCLAGTRHKDALPARGLCLTPLRVTRAVGGKPCRAVRASANHVV